MRNRWNGTIDALDTDGVMCMDVDVAALDAIGAQSSDVPPDVVVVDATAMCTTCMSRRVALDADGSAEDHVDWVVQMCLAEYRNICNRYPSAAIEWVFDSRNNRDYRNTLLNGYKHGRVSQFDPRVRREVLTRVPQEMRRLGATIVTLDRWEADDAMADLVRYHIQMRRVVLLISRDSDLAQLRYVPNAAEYLRFHPARDTTAPCGTVDYWWGVKALMGDVGDNVAGVHGVGEKHATQGVTQRKIESAAHLERVGTGIQCSEVIQRIIDRNVRCVRL